MTVGDRLVNYFNMLTPFEAKGLYRWSEICIISSKIKNNCKLFSQHIDSILLWKYNITNVTLKKYGGDKK